jgi:Tfp pilus assembly protein PilN
MAAVVAAAVVYLVVVSNQVSAERDHIAQLSTQVVASEGQAAALKPYADFVDATMSRRGAVSAVVKSRFKWDRTLTELARVAPEGVWLTSVKATLSPGTQIDGGTSAGNTSGLRGALTSPALELTGCATRQGSVPAYIDQLHLLTGVTDVGFNRTERLSKHDPNKSGDGGCGAGTSTQAASFELVAYFKALPAQLATAAATTTTPAATPAATTAPATGTAATSGATP